MPIGRQRSAGMKALVNLPAEEGLDGAQPFAVHGAGVRFYCHRSLVRRLRGQSPGSGARSLTESIGSVKDGRAG